MFQLIEEITKKVRDSIPYSHWENWSPIDYLKTYFLKIGPDSYENLKFLTEEMKSFDNNSVDKMLDFGSGPTVFSALVAAPYVKKIILCDYLETNLQEINSWLRKDDHAFNWHLNTGLILKFENNDISIEAILQREDEARAKISRLIRCDASLHYPCFTETIEKYPLIISNFCADSATSSKEVWEAYMKNLLSLVDEGGTILLSALRNCTYYLSGSNIYPSANINEKDLYYVFKKNGFRILKILIRNVDECKIEGFDSLLFVRAIRDSNVLNEDNFIY